MSLTAVGTVRRPEGPATFDRRGWGLIVTGSADRSINAARHGYPGPMTDLHALIHEAGTTFAADAGITLTDAPQPLFQLLVLTQLSSARISADIAVAAARELFRSGWRTPDAMATAGHRKLVEALDAGGYARYDESTAPRLGELAERVRTEYQGDLRRLATRSEQRVPQASRLIHEFNGIGPVGGEIFLREVQDTWIWVRPYLDRRAQKGAGLLGLPTAPEELARQVPGRAVAPLASALVRVAGDRELRERFAGDGA